MLQNGGVIAYHRGDLQVLDRGVLERAACDCYRKDLKRYATLFRDTRSSDIGTYDTHSG